MKDYKLLAIRYLKQNRQRSVITIIGTAVTVMLLYGFLNVAWGYLLQTREELRASQDYEMVLYTETQEQVESILADDLVKSAYIGQYYAYKAGEGQMYNDTLYVNTVNPYQIDSIFERLCAKYGVNGVIHNELAWTYLQGSDGSLVVVIIYFSILAAFIFAIIGVGMVRNSIQMNMFENIRDYGNLRCIGSSKGELKVIIYLQGMVLEVIGILLGTLAGTIITSILSVYLASINLIKFKGGFHLLPLLLVTATFLIDLYFAMGENAKLVTRMTPVAAIRGEYRIRKERIRLHEKNPFRLLANKVLGVDGDYAFKNLMRSPGRFFRTIGAMVFGIAAAMGIITFAGTIYNMERQELGKHGYYQMFVNNRLDLMETIEGVEASFPPEEALQELSDIPEFTEVKRSYSALGLCTDAGTLAKHYSEDFRNSYQGKRYLEECERLQDRLEADDREEKSISYSMEAMEFVCYGYDEEDLNRCQSVLMDGTTQLSDHGILIVNQVRVADPIEQEDGAIFFDDSNGYDVAFTDFHVGDTIEIVDIGEFHKRLREPLAEMNDVYGTRYQEAIEENSDGWNQEADQIRREFIGQAGWLMVDIWKELVAEGAYKTYTVEGIIEEDVNYKNDYEFLNGESLTVLMSKDCFFDLTGLTAEQPTGINYHLAKIPARNMNMFSFDDMAGMDTYSYQDKLLSSTADISWVAGMVQLFQSIQRDLIIVSMIAGFFVMVAVINTINATASNLHMRRREFAQLRVIGVSKLHLIKMVMLEGIITSVIGSVIGVILGGVLCYAIMVTLELLLGMKYYFPVIAAILAVLVAVLVTCGSIYFPIQKLGNDLADDLKTSGD